MSRRSRKSRESLEERIDSDRPEFDAEEVTGVYDVVLERFRGASEQCLEKTKQAAREIERLAETE